MRLRGAAVTLFACAALGACSAPFTEMTAGPSDYSDYRAVRIAPTVADQLHAASVYLENNPEGAFRGTVSAFMAETEPLFYEAFADSPVAMQAYLAALP